MADGESFYAGVLSRRASRLGDSNRVCVIFSGVALVFGVIAIALLITLVVKSPHGVGAEVMRTFGAGAARHYPQLPQGYPNTARNKRVIPGNVVIFGDQWALGEGDTPWFQQMQDDHFPASTMITAALSEATVASLAHQADDLMQRFPRGIPGIGTAVIVQVGANDLFVNDTADTARAVLAAARRLVLNMTLFTGSPRPSLYLIDYPDPSAHTGFCAVSCGAPLDAIYNFPDIETTFNYIHTFDLFSAALQTLAIQANVAFVPLRAALHKVGTAPITANLANHDPIDTRGNSLPLGMSGVPFSSCDGLNDVGQRYQSDIVAAFLTNDVYYEVG